MKKKTIMLLLALVMLFSVMAPVCALADGDDTAELTSVTIIGGDLNASQKEEVYQIFGINQGDVKELSMTFAEEKAYMSGKVPAEQLGSRSISSAYIQLAEEGKGISVQTHNITWVTAEMYTSALITAGVTDADIIVAAPFRVSGTAALAGIFKAYETVTGTELDDAAKDVAGDEIIVTGELGEVLGSEEAMMLMNELKQLLSEVKDMSDEELHQVIVDTAKEFNVELTESQIEKIQSLLRKMAELNIDPVELLKQAQGMQEKFENLAKVGQKTAGFFASVANFFNNIASWFKDLFGISQD